MKILSINIAKVGLLFPEQSGTMHRVMTGIHKVPLAGSVAVNRLGLAGDEQADLSLHGGLEKAIYAYPAEHYAFWRMQRAAIMKCAPDDITLPPGALGENLTLDGLLESMVWIGDRLQLGSALLEVSEPRQPCFKFKAKMGFAHAAKLMVQSGFSGFYLSVIETGSITAGDLITLIPGPREVTLNQINEQRRKGRQHDLF